MQTYLNDEGEYYTRTGTAANYGLKATAKNMISDAKYYLGGTAYYNVSSSVSADYFYQAERGTEVLSYENYCLYRDWDTTKCASNYCENNPDDLICNATRSTSWVGEVALMYPSDYVYTYIYKFIYDYDDEDGDGVYIYTSEADCYYPYDSSCYFDESNNYWIYTSNNLEGQEEPYDIWLLTPDNYFSKDVNNILYTGSIPVYDNDDNFNAAFLEYGVRPVVYLSSSVQIDSGTGTELDPYILTY